LAEEIWHRVVSILEGLDDDSKKELLRLEKIQTPIIGAYLVGLNERFRFLRYNPSDYFRAHEMDATFVEMKQVKIAEVRDIL
jgi:hypothetical protein